ncbi:choloylglycine hydrolase family protein [Liquorilactobacillus satsumensis]|uniref:choloylglycine hydrolase family protein n=1 Tax=Liquorilactobacillus satsumensis TaxID=259059 RepID=UPI0039E9B7BE
MIGCSSLTLNTQDHKHLLARTMDFTIEMAEEVIFVPRGKSFKTNYTSAAKITAKYANMGIGQLNDHAPILFDGLNEKGLMGATLYFPRYAHYSQKMMPERTNVSPDKVIATVLATAANLTEAATLFKNSLNIVAQENATIGTVPPLHYIFSDQSGASLIVEPRADGVQLIEDSIGVMTNSPDYRWHENNLRNYLTVTAQQHAPVKFLNKTLFPFSQGSGTFGLPGDYTPPARFIRVAFLKNAATQVANEIAGISLLHHILEAVSIPQGAVVTERGTQDYTCYTAYMCAESLSFYFSTYFNQRINKISLAPLLLEKDYKIFKINNHEDLHELN